jgi:hypothetical protein
VYLTDAQRSAVLSIAHSYGIEGNPEDLVHSALTAITYCEATEAAYSVAEAADAYELFPGAWYRKEKELNAAQARAILTQAKKDASYEAPIPEDDAKAISEANDLVEMAQTAWDQYVRGPEVEAILRLAAADFSDGNGASAPTAEETPSEPEEPPKPEPTPESVAPEPAAAPESGEDTSPDLSKVEPWDGYENEKVGDINAAINAAPNEMTPDELRELMANIWAWEMAHKRRVRIIGTLNALAERLDKEAEGATPEAQDKEVVKETPPDELDGQPPAEPGPQPEAPAPPAEEPVEEKPEVPEPEKAVETEQPSRAETDDEDYSNLVRTVQDEIRRERLHTPEPPQEEVPDLPWDWTKITGDQLQRFYGIYSALAYYKGYTLAFEERMASHCRAAADELHRDLLNASDKYDDHGKEKKVSHLEAEIEADSNVMRWRKRQRKHEIFATQARQERDSYNKLVESLSRLETMRHNEWERSGGKVGRR